MSEGACSLVTTGIVSVPIVLAKVNILLVKPVLPAACGIAHVTWQCPGVQHRAPSSVWALSPCLSCKNICCMPIKTPAAGASLCGSGLAGLRIWGSGQVEVSLSWLLMQPKIRLWLKAKGSSFESCSCLSAVDELPYCQSCSECFKDCRPPLLWERMTMLRMLNIVLKVQSILSVLMLCCSGLRAFCSGYHGDVHVLGCSHSWGQVSLPQVHEWMRLHLSFLMVPPLSPVMSASLGYTSYSVLPWVRGCGCHATLHPCLFWGAIFAAGTFEVTFLSRDPAKTPKICQVDGNF